jgi:hypothetical protein
MFPEAEGEAAQVGAWPVEGQAWPVMATLR